MTVAEGAKATLLRCRVRANAEQGVALHPPAAAQVRGCDLRDNAAGAWLVEPGAQLEQSDNQE